MSYPPIFEWLKRIAFVAMLIDHVDMILLDRSQAWMWAIGRIAFPIFVFTFAFGLAYSRDPARVGLRVLAVACVAQGVWWLVDPTYGANVLFVMALAAFAALGSAARPWPWLVVFVVYLLAVGRIEGGVLGLLCLIVGTAAGLWWRDPADLPPRALVLVSHALPRLPRSGPWLLWAYPLHLAAFGALAAIVSR